MQRLIGDAEQGAVRNPEAETIGGDGGRFHIETDGPALRQSLNRTVWSRNSQLRFVDRGHGAGTHDLLEIIPGISG